MSPLWSLAVSARLVAKPSVWFWRPVCSNPIIIDVMDIKTYRHFGITYGVALTSAVATLVVSYFAFRWSLICYQEWQIGHKNPFTIWADMRAVPFAFLTAVIVFWLVLVVMKRPKRKHT
jgi:hypothetical protein